MSIFVSKRLLQSIVPPVGQRARRPLKVQCKHLRAGTAVACTGEAASWDRVVKGEVDRGSSGLRLRLQRQYDHKICENGQKRRFFRSGFTIQQIL